MFGISLAVGWLAGAAARADDPGEATSARAVLRVESPPLGLPPIMGAHPPSAAQVTLGRRLFFDPRLSASGSFACATCHDPAQAFARRDAPTALGQGGAPLRRNAPTLLNAAYATSLFWDGRARSLEEQVAGPLFAGDEMANASPDELVDRLDRVPDYRAGFLQAYGERPSMALIARARRVRADASFRQFALRPMVLWRRGFSVGCTSGRRLLPVRGPGQLRRLSSHWGEPRALRR
jgi:cytochrome c peroxidase